MPAYRTMIHPASFRDPSGFVYTKDEEIYRHINPIYFDKFEHLHKSGLYDQLVQDKFLISHVVVEEDTSKIIIKPNMIPFISYPVEWPFYALKSSALLTLKINIQAIKFDMILKDASSYNVQFVGPNPIFIDTLSFDLYRKDLPWSAFGQFCRHFISSLLLMKYCHTDVNKMLISFIDGIPLDVASSLLPLRTHFSLFIKSNIHIHAKALKANQDVNKFKKDIKLSKGKLTKLLNYVYDFVDKLELKGSIQWDNYYGDNSYEEKAFVKKGDIVRRWCKSINASKILDVGGNDGSLSNIPGSNTILCNTDLCSLNRGFLDSKKTSRNMVSLLVDIASPTPAYGFANKERSSFLNRVYNWSPECVLALALVHHLCISQNCSFDMLAKLFTSLGKHLIIEFVDRDDGLTQKLLIGMRDQKILFDWYNKDNFEKAFQKEYAIDQVHQIEGMHRTLYLMTKKN